MSLIDPTVSQIRRQIHERGPPVPFLPPEVKLVILNYLPLKDVRNSITLVDKAWGSAAKASLGERGTFILNERTLDEILQLDENKKMYCKKIKIERTNNNEETESLSELTFKTMEVLNNKVEGGGVKIEHLVIGDFRCNSKEESSGFFDQLFLACPNVKQLSLLNDLSGLELNDTSVGKIVPVLKYCLCVEWLQFARLLKTPSMSLFLVTPNVTRIIAPPDFLWVLKAKHYWPKLQKIQHFQFPNNRDRLYCLPGALIGWIRPLRVISFLVVPQFTTSGILKVMDAFSGTLEIFELQSYWVSARKDIRERVPNDPTPVMRKLHTLSFVDAEPEDFSKVGFIFGDVLNPTFVEHPMRLDTHFPALKSLRFTVRETADTRELTQQSCIFLLNFFPILLDSNDWTSYPNMKTLELNWPDPDKDWNLWKDWTRRVVSKFPNLQGNPHVDKWRELKCKDDQRGDKVDIEWQNYQQRYEARRRNTPPLHRKPWW